MFEKEQFAEQKKPDPENVHTVWLHLQKIPE